jgi:hypothetical protein
MYVCMYVCIMPCMGSHMEEAIVHVTDMLEILVFLAKNLWNKILAF